MKKSVRWLAIAAWVGLLAFFVVRESTQGAAAPGLAAAIAATEATDEDAQEWFGLYAVQPNGEKSKIGYASSKHNETSVGYQTETSTYMRLALLGAEQIIRTESKFLTGADHRLQYVDFLMTTDTIKFKVTGTVRGNEINLEIETAGGVQKQTLSLPEPPVMQDDIAALLADKGGLRVGATADLPFFDPTTRRYDKAHVRVVERIEYKTPSGGNVVAYRLETLTAGATGTTIVDERGRTLEETMANISMIREPKQTALTENWREKPTDLPEMERVKVDRPIPNARDAKSLKVRLSGVKFDDLPLTDDRQTFADGVLSVEVRPLPAKGAFKTPYHGADLELLKRLKPEPLIESDDPSIVEQAKKIVPVSVDALAAAGAITDWVYKNLDKQPLVSMTSAKEVLMLRKGKCNEHAALFTALARAAGLPAVTYVGLVYARGAFYYHAWNGVYVGEWLSVDPTFGQFPADATHLRIVSGGLDKQLDIVRLMGAVKVEVLDAK